MTGKTFVRLERIRGRIEHDLEVFSNLCRKQVVIPPLEQLRPATAADVIEGEVFYYPNDADNAGNPFWQIISEVQYPNDDFKAYMGEDGCRYGLRGAYVVK